MQKQVLPPGVEDGEEADAGSEMAPTGGNGEQSLRAGLEQNTVEGGFVLQGQRVELFRDGEDDVEVLHWQQLGLPAFQPSAALQILALRAMAIEAGVVFRLSWKWRGRSAVKITERAREENQEALHSRREGRHLAPASAGA